MRDATRRNWFEGAIAALALRLLALLGTAWIAVACGGSAPGGGGGSGGGGTSGTVSLALRLLDGAGADVTQLAAGQSAQAQATVTRGGKAVANEIVTFSVENSTLAGLSPSSGAILTDSSGVARIALNAATGQSGATRVSAKTTVGGQTAGAETNFSVALASTGGLKIASLAVSVAQSGLSAYGTTSILVTVTDNAGAPPAQPVTVAFSSTCPSGKATITASGTTLPNGTVQGTFTDAGCAPNAPLDVTITASIATESKSQSFRLNPPSSGSLRFISSNPSDRSITLKGQGGVGRQEFATLTFRLVDVAGNGVSDSDVCFDATTYSGGLNVDGFNSANPPPVLGSTTLCGSDNTLRYVKRTGADGAVTVQVNSGTTPTPLRVRARTIYPVSATVPLETVSDSLSISTGLPLQRTFDLSWESSNIEGRERSGTTTSFTARLADQFGNPVPDGTVVNFITSGGAICTSQSGSCTTQNGACSCTLTSQEPRPNDGRVVVLAYTVGLEDFTDTNNNNQYEPGEPFVDLPDAFLDANKDGSLTTGEVALRYQNQNAYSPTGDGVRDTAHLRRTAIVTFSSANAPLVIIPAVYNSAGAIKIPATSCSATGVIPSFVSVWAEDGFGNPLAAQSGLSTVARGTVVGAAIDPAAVPNLVIGGPIPARDSPDVPKTSTSLGDIQLLGTRHTLTLTPVTNQAQTACNIGSAGVEIRVQSPTGVNVSAQVLFEGEARSLARFAVPVVVQ